jgi:Outer membrane protein beta-barrel domain
MKKLTVVFITLLFAYTGFSQSYFRVQAGPVFNYLKAEGTDVGFDNLNTGFTFGAAYEMVAAKNFSIQPELNFTHLSAEESITTAKLKFDYIQIPLLLKAVNNKRNFSFYVGPQLGFLTKGTLEQSGSSSDIKDDLTQTDFSAVLGIEYVLQVNVFLSARFTQGFSNVYKAEFDSPNTTRHQIFGVGVGYIFTKKK